MTKQEIINKYKEKVNRLNKSIAKIIKLIEIAKKEDVQEIDIEDLLQEKENANRDRQLYFQFTKDLEDLK